MRMDKWGKVLNRICTQTYITNVNVCRREKRTTILMTTGGIGILQFKEIRKSDYS